ncbi:MAG: hypothetical protein HFE75_11470 [Firmicutes bacterium]|jgi:hypothetical protein|nr:hypothetical protein [Bacillota bacterium]
MDRADRTKLSVTNHRILQGLSIMEAARLICYLCYDCERCPVNDPDWSIKRCWGRLAVWLREAKDEEFWEYLLEGKE